MVSERAANPVSLDVHQLAMSAWLPLHSDANLVSNLLIAKTGINTGNIYNLLNWMLIFLAVHL